MSTVTKLRMLHNAITTREEAERHARRLLAQATCPCLSVFASTGAPSTESSYTCCFAHGIPGRDPGCPSYGQVRRCTLLADLRRRGRLCEFLALRQLQCAHAEFVPQVEGLVGWFALPESASFSGANGPKRPRRGNPQTESDEGRPIAKVEVE